MVLSKLNRQSKIFPFEFSMRLADGNERHLIEDFDLEKDL